MDRIKRFFGNSGIAAVVQCVIIGVVIFFAMRKDVGSGLWVTTLPVLVISFFACYPLRSWLVDHFGIVRILMNSAVLVAVVMLAVVRNVKGPESIALRIGLSIFIGLYMGLYFWLMSDERITRG